MLEFTVLLGADRQREREREGDRQERSQKLINFFLKSGAVIDIACYSLLNSVGIKVLAAMLLVGPVCFFGSAPFTVADSAAIGHPSQAPHTVCRLYLKTIVEQKSYIPSWPSHNGAQTVSCGGKSWREKTWREKSWRETGDFHVLLLLCGMAALCLLSHEEIRHAIPSYLGPLHLRSKT